VTCVECGAEFPRGTSRKPPTLCSAPCKRKRASRLQVERYWDRLGGEVRETVECKECGTLFEYVRAQGERGRPAASFCSDECRKAVARRNGARNTASHRARMTSEERAARWRAWLLARYGLTSERYDAMVAKQGGVCAICGQPDTDHHSPLLKIDHDRSCCPRNGSCGRCVRALLCSACNTGLGLFGDDPGLLRAAADYLERHRALPGAG
jgi:hypothetical protein